MKAYRLIVLLLFAANVCSAQRTATYLRPVYNTPDSAQSGVAYWEMDTCSNCLVVAASGSVWGVAGQTTWYVVKGTVTFPSTGVTCNGDVHLILSDNSSLRITGNQTGIKVTEGSSLTIYAQSRDRQRMGSLTVYGGSYNAAIGGGNSQAGENITINGGEVSATGGICGAGIGGGNLAKGKNIVINGGVVSATGGDGGSGIGGGSGRGAENVVINGGVVTATGGNNGAGIGGTSSSNIYFSDSMLVKAHASVNPPTTVVQHSSSVDMSSALSGKRYVTAVQCVRFVAKSDNDSQGRVVYSQGRVPMYGRVTVQARAAAHHHLLSWSDCSSVDSVRTLTVTCDTSITAYFELDWHSVSVEIEGGKGVAEGAGLYQYGDKVTLRAVADGGYRFSAWKDGNDTVWLAETYFFTIVCDTVITLAFEVDPTWTAVEGVEEGLIMRNPVGVGEGVVVRREGIDYAEVYSMEGALICRRESSGGVVELDGVTVAGIYVVRVVDLDGRVSTAKLIVQ